jgi:hypothetical protein
MPDLIMEMAKASCLFDDDLPNLERLIFYFYLFFLSKARRVRIAVMILVHGGLGKMSTAFNFFNRG